MKPSEAEAALNAQYDQIRKLVMAKREDYGTDNINQTGLAGIAVRLVDKTARLFHLVRRGDPLESSDPLPPNFELTDDTLQDIAGYALIALVMEEKGEW